MNLAFENLVLYFLYLEVLLYFRIYAYTSMTKIYYLMRVTQMILDIGFYQWSRICRIIVDETQKEWRLNWTFVDKFFVGIFLKKIWWIGWKIDGCNSPNLGGLCAISALKLFFKWMDLKQVSTFLMIIKTGYFLFYHLKIIKIWFMKIEVCELQLILFKYQEQASLRQSRTQYYSNHFNIYASGIAAYISSMQSSSSDNVFNNDGTCYCILRIFLLAKFYIFDSPTF